MDGDSESPLRYPLGIRCRHLSVYASTHATYSGVAILSYVIRATCFLSIYAISDLRKVYIVLEIGTRCYGVRRDCRVCCVWTCRILRLDWGADVYLRTDHGAFVKYSVCVCWRGTIEGETEGVYMYIFGCVFCDVISLPSGSSLRHGLSTR